MSRIDDLIRHLCPDGVEFVALGSVCSIFSGSAFASSYFNTRGEGLPLIRIRDVNSGASGTFYSGPYDDRFIVNDGDILIGMDGDFRPSRWHGGTALLNQRVCRLQDFDSSVVPDYVYYLAIRVLEKIQGSIQASTVKHLSSRQLATTRIPLPPLEVQREIVRILDQFTQLEAELEAELEARTRQYNHYRHQFLGLAADHPRTAIVELIHGVSSGRNNSRIEGGAYPVYGSTGRIGSTDEPEYSHDALLIARVGANAGRVNAVRGNYDVSDNTLIVSPTDKWDIRFAFHQLTHMHLNQYAVGGGQPLVTSRLIKSLEVVVPPLDEQRRIAKVLDQFDDLVNDLSTGLPAELAARCKQYEYYRDKLLTFEEVS